MESLGLFIFYSVKMTRGLRNTVVNTFLYLFLLLCKKVGFESKALFVGKYLMFGDKFYNIWTFFNGIQFHFVLNYSFLTIFQYFCSLLNIKLTIYIFL